MSRPPPPPILSHPHRITWFSVTFFFVGLFALAAAWENPIKSWNFSGLIKISQIWERIPMEHIEPIYSLDSQLLFTLICSIRIRSRKNDTLEIVPHDWYWYKQVQNQANVEHVLYSVPHYCGHIQIRFDRLLHVVRDRVPYARNIVSLLL